MTTARRDIVDLDVTRYYHCISRCVRRAKLCGEGFEHRKQWIEDRLQLLAQNFAIGVAGFAVMDSHMHVLVRLEPEQADDWSDDEVIRRWIAVYPPRHLDLDDPQTVEKWVRHEARDTKKVQQIRQRLGNLGWFMKALKEPLARMANREEDCRGTFWEARYKSIAVLDEEALLATCAYIDLNPFAAGLSAAPETAKHTSIRQRLAHVRRKGKLSCLKAARKSSAAGSQAAGNVEQDHWLIPIDDRRHRSPNAREGLLESFSLGSYLQVLDYTARLYREGKARLNEGVAEVFDRLGIGDEFWFARLKGMLTSRSLHGRCFAGDREKLRELAAQRGKHHVTNLSPQQAS